MSKADPCAGLPALFGITFLAYPPPPPNANEFFQRIAKTRTVMFLCPRSFELQVPEVIPPALRHNLDRKAHAVGTELLDMQTNPITLYHEMFHVVIYTTTPDKKNLLTPDAKAVGAKEDPEGKAYQG